MKRILVNGLGCVETGGKLVLQRCLAGAPDGFSVLSFEPGAGWIPRFRFEGRLCRLLLPHKVFGQLLRPLVEICIGIAVTCRMFDRLVNLSNYSLCWSSRQVLYLQNPHLIDLDAGSKGLGRGRSNLLTRAAVDVALRHSALTIVQTEHCRRKVDEYTQRRGIGRVQVEVVYPSPEIPPDISPKPRQFGFQLYYPASPFPHKRVSLALGGVRLARGQLENLGLVITVSPALDVTGGAALCVGLLPRAEALRWYPASDALLFTSEHETLGFPLLESLHFGLPAVLPNLDYAKELYGDAAVYFESPEPESIAQAIWELHTRFEEYRARAAGRRRELFGSLRSWASHWDLFLGRGGDYPGVRPTRVAGTHFQ